MKLIDRMGKGRENFRTKGNIYFVTQDYVQILFVKLLLPFSLNL